MIHHAGLLAGRPARRRGIQQIFALQETRTTDWSTPEIVGNIDPDAARITIGMTFRGLGSVHFTAAEFETVE